MMKMRCSTMLSCTGEGWDSSVVNDVDDGSGSWWRAPLDKWRLSCKTEPTSCPQPHPTAIQIPPRSGSANASEGKALRLWSRQAFVPLAANSSHPQAGTACAVGASSLSRARLYKEGESAKVDLVSVGRYIIVESTA